MDFLLILYHFRAYFKRISSTIRIRFHTVCYITSFIDAPSETLSYTLQIEKELAQLQEKLDNMDARLFPEDRVFSNISCVYGQFQPESNTITLTLSFKSNTAYAHFQNAILYCNGKNIPLTLENGNLTTTYEVNIFELQTISAITFIDDEIMKTEFFSLNIDPSSQVIPKLISIANINTSGKGILGLAYSGSVHISVVHFPEKSGEIKEINLLKRLDGKEESRSPIKHQYQNLFLDSFTINKKVNGHIPEGSTLEIIIELVDEYGLHYQCSLRRINSDGEGIWDTIDKTNVYDKNGIFLYEIQS